MSVSLQPEDEVVQKAIAYAQGVLGLDQDVSDGFPEEIRVVGGDENVYLYGHGGSSSYAQEDHDLFARLNMGQLADRLAPRLPEGYTGTIYLIGCSTAPVVADLTAELLARTDQDVRVLGTPEKLVAKGDGSIVSRRAPGDDAEAVEREARDEARRHHGKLQRLRDGARSSGQALLRATDYHQRRAAVSNVIDTLQALDSLEDRIKAGLRQLGDNPVSNTLLGRQRGLQDLLRFVLDLQELKGTMMSSLQAWIKLGSGKFASDEEVRVAEDLGLELDNMAGLLERRVKEEATLINLLDSFEDGVPFDLALMGQPAPPALADPSSDEDLDTSLDSYDSDSEETEEGSSSLARWLIGGSVVLGLTFLGALAYRRWRPFG